MKGVNRQRGKKKNYKQADETTQPTKQKADKRRKLKRVAAGFVEFRFSGVPPSRTLFYACAMLVHFEPSHASRKNNGTNSKRRWLWRNKGALRETKFSANHRLRVHARRFRHLWFSLSTPSRDVALPRPTLTYLAPHSLPLPSSFSLLLSFLFFFRLAFFTLPPDQVPNHI